MTTYFIPRLLTGAALSAALCASAAHATTVHDDAHDRLPTFVANTATTDNFDDLDVVSASATFDDQNLYLSATMAGAIGSTVDGFYVWGLDTGSGIPFFQNLHNSDPLHQPDIGNGVIFDTFIILNPNGTGSVHYFSGAPTNTLSASAIGIDGDVLSAAIPLSMLHLTNGFGVGDIGANIWPRITGFDNTHVSDFAPNDRNFQASAAVPEPASWALMIMGFGGLGVALRRRRSLLATPAT